MNKFYFTLSLFLLTCTQTIAQSHPPATLYLMDEKERFSIPAGHLFSEVNICNLEKGTSYDYWIDGKENSFTAESDCFTLPYQTSFSENKDFEFSIARKTTHVNGNQKLLTNLAVDNSFNPQELVTNILIGGNCYNVTGVDDIGSQTGIGYFYNGMESIGFDEGVILSSGSIFNAPGPNNLSSAGTNLPGTNNDSDLSQMATNDVSDATGIEFDFTPTTDLIEFEYVFASEEYCEYVNSTYNDVFGFFISGPGINGEFQFNGENIALLPNSTDNVAINSVNHLENSQYFNGNHANCGPNPSYTENIQYDGFTSVLTARAQVIPCETYHIRLVVGDVSDALWDSAVFLKANSFQAFGGALVEANSEFSGTNIAYEGCQNGEFIFSRDSEEGLNEDLIIDFEVSNAGLATPNVDYVDFPSIITIPAGQMTATLNVEIINDDIVEGEESIILEVPASCNCSQSNVTLLVQDVQAIQIEPNDPEVCGSESVVLTAISQGGMGEYSYLWSTGATTESITVPPLGTGSQAYTVTVTDECDNESIGQSLVTALNVPTATLDGYGELCPEDTQSLIALNIELTGEQAWEVTYSYEGVLQPNLLITESPYVLNVNGLGNYNLESISYTDGYCPGTVSGTAEIVQTELPTAILSGGGEFCRPQLENEVALQLDLTGAGPWEISYELNGVSQEMVTINDANGSIPVDEFGSYSLNTVSYTNGLCMGTSSGSALISEKEISIEATATDAECADTNTGTITLTGLDGTSPYFFDWENHDLNSSHPENLYAGDYPVTMTDAAGCTAETSVSVGQPARLNAFVDKVEGLCEGDLGKLIFTETQGGTPGYIYSIDGGDSYTNTSIFEGLMGGEYDLIVQDANGCEWIEKAQITEPPSLELWTEPNAEIELGDSYDIDIQTNIPLLDIQTIEWSNSTTLDCSDCLEPVASPLFSTPYEIIVTTSNGCVETTNLIVIVNKEDAPVFVPNAFSPDNDGINDVFTVFAKEEAVTNIKSMTIYSRWGEPVYVANDFVPNDLSMGWNGIFRDKPVNTGVFLWHIEVEYIDGTSEILKGDVTVMR